MNFGKRMKEMRIRAGLTQRQLADRMGFKHNAVSNWEHEKSIPDANIITLLCHHLSITPNQLLWGEGLPSPFSPTSISPEEHRLLLRWRQMGTAAQMAATALMDHFLATAPTVQPSSASVSVVSPAVEVDFLIRHISTQSVAAGTGTYLNDDDFEELRVLRNPLTSRAAFFVPVSGDSMEPRFHDGNILMVEQAPVRRGEIGVFTIDNLGYVKVNGDGKLLSLNPAYEPIPMNDSILCNGKVIGVLEESWILE